MGWFGALFGTRGPRRPPAWARDAFGTDGARFDALVAVVIDVLADAGFAVSAHDVRTGSVMLGDREWVFEDLAHRCATVAPAAWPAIVTQRLSRPGEPDLEDRDDARPAEAAPRGESKAWIIGAAPWGIVFEAGAQEMVVVLLPTTAPVEVPALPEGLVTHVIVCNGGDEGHLAATATARAAGLAVVFATHPGRPVDRGGAAEATPSIEVQPLTSVRAGPLTVERRESCMFGRWHDGVTFLAGEAIPMAEFARAAPAYVVGKLVVDGGDAGRLIDAVMTLKRALIVANTPGVDARRLAETLAMLGATAEIVNAGPADAPDVSAMSAVLAHVMTGDLARADAIAAAAIAAGERVDDMRHQRAMIALMRGDDTAAEAELAQLASAEALSSRAIIAARRGDPAALDHARRAVARLPGDAIAIRAAIAIHAGAGDLASARALLAEHGHHLAAGPRAELAHALEDPATLPREMAHRFPQHAALALAAVAPMIAAGDHAAAEGLLRRASAWDPDNVGVTGELGVVLSRQDQDDAAIAVYDAAIARGGANQVLRFNRANCHLRGRRAALAVTDLQVCLELEPAWHDARINLTSALVAAGDREAAHRELAQLEERGGPAHAIEALRLRLRDAT